MTNNDKFFTDINNHYNILKNNISKSIDISKDFDYVFSNDNNIDIVEIYFDGKIKIKAEYNFIGMFNIPFSIWYWSWNIAFINKNLIKEMLPVKNFSKSMILEKNYYKYNKKNTDELYYITSNDNFYISHKNIDKILKLVLFLTKSVWYFPIKYINNKNQLDKIDKIHYILITKIIQFI